MILGEKTLKSEKIHLENEEINDEDCFTNRKNYQDILAEIEYVSRNIDIYYYKGVYRMLVCMKETEFLEKLKEELLKRNSSWEIISRSKEIIVDCVKIKLELSYCRAPITKITLEDFSFSSKNYNNKNGACHYLLKNKLTGESIIKSIFDMSDYHLDVFGNVKIDWKNEIKKIPVVKSEEEYNSSISRLKNLFFL